MRRPPPLLGQVEDSIGYVLKVAATALRGAMEDDLRPLGLTVSQYAILENLRQRERMSNAELARAAFVSPQSMNGVLRGLQSRGLLARPDAAPAGRARHALLTEAGARLAAEASARVAAVERRMLAGLGDGEQTTLLQDLRSCIDGLTGGAGR